MRFLKSLFNKPETTTQRILTQPQQLVVGDIFCFGDSFALAEAMRKQQVQVTDIHTVEFKHEHYVQITGQAANQLIYLSFPRNPQQQIKCSLLLSREQVEQLFDLDDFAEIFEEPGNAQLATLTDQHAYADMLAQQYIQQDFATSGYLHHADYRDSKPPQYDDEEHGQEFEYFSLQDKQGTRSIDIYVFENGDTDVYLSQMRSQSDIAELWPKGA